MALVTHDKLRALIYPALSTAPSRTPSDTELLSSIHEGAPSLFDWKVYDHCAAFTRLYAVYERFVTDLIFETVDELPSLYAKYGELPLEVSATHRKGIGGILPTVGEHQYRHLSEEQVVRCLLGITGDNPYTLLPDAFMTSSERQNLRKEILERLFPGIGVQNVWHWVTSHEDMQRFFREVRGDEGTAEGELRSFIQYRNEAAHRRVDEVVATEEICNIADFVETLCRVLAEATMSHILSRQIEIGQARVIGIVTHKHRDRVVIATMEPGLIAVGDRYLIMRDSACYSVNVESIQIDDVPHDSFQIVHKREIGLCLTREAKNPSRIVRILG